MPKKKSLVTFSLMTIILAGIVAAWHTTRSMAALQLSSSVDVQAHHVFIVMLENHSYSRVIGNSSMPYLNSLAYSYAYANSYYANTHPSIGNYFELTTGKIITNNDGYSATVTADNIVRHLIFAGKTWKEYSEGLPYVGYIGRDTGEYTQHHNPLSYFSDVRNSSQKQNLVPFSQFAADLANHAFPQYSFIVPNNDDNGHDCLDATPSCTDNQKLAAVDSWLGTNIGPLVASSDFKAVHGGTLVIVFDEAASSDTKYGGGHVAWIVVGPDVKKGHISTTLYQHQSTLRFMSEMIGLTTFPGYAATAPDMEEFITGD
jgi:phosphatidylinositol-3-phosphatase